jgi:uncharacterized protein (DUF779 family)
MPDMVTLSMAKKYALKMNNVGVQGAISDKDGITWTLKDGTTLYMSISNWHNLTLDEQKVLAMLVPMSNDGGATYLGSDLQRYILDKYEVNNNKAYSFSINDWINVSNDKYTLTKIHNLGGLDIIPYVKNSSGKAEIVGIDTSVDNIITLTSTYAFDGKIILNYSSSNGNKINSICTVNSSYIFTSITDRDTYFGTTNISALKNGLLCMVNDGTTKTLYTWEDVDSPLTYDNTKWSNSTALIKGETGIGLKPSHKWIDTKLYFELPDGGYDSGVNLKGSTGDVGTKLNPRGVWDKDTNYIASNDSIDVVNYNNIAYCCLLTNTGKQPDINSECWTILLNSVLSTNNMIIDTTSEYPKLQMQLANDDLFDVIKNASDNQSTIIGDITRSTHIDSSEDIMLGKIDNNNDVSFDINTDESETQSVTQCIFDYVPFHGGYVTAISMDLSDVQTNTQVRFIIKDKNTNQTIYSDKFVVSDFANGTDTTCYLVTNGSQTITLNKPFALANSDTHTFEFYFNKTVTIKGKTISNIFIPKCYVTAKEIRIETVATQEWSLKNGLYQIEDSLSPNGMKDVDNTYINFDDTTRTFTINPKTGVSSYTYYVIGTRVVVTDIKTIQIPNTTGVYYICIDGSGTLSYSNSYSVDDYSKLPLLFVRWNANLGLSESQWDMRIGNLWLDVKTRSYMLNTSGVEFNEGFQINDILNGDGSTDLQTQVSLTEGSIKVAERTFYITNATNPINSFENKMSPLLYTKNFYRSGVTNDFTVEDASTIPLKKGITLPCYNKNTNGTWSVQEAISGNYISVFIGCSTDIRPNSNFFAIMGQWQDTTLLNAKANQTFSNLDLGNLNKKACKILYKLIYKVSSNYTNTFKATLVDVEDLRNVATIEISASLTVEHNSLANRNAPHAHTSDAIDANILSPLSDSTTAIKIQNADRTKDLIVFDTSNGYINNKAPISICSMTTTERLSLTNIPSNIIVYDSTLGCNMQCIDTTNEIWVQI